jgi:hypothetical protein
VGRHQAVEQPGAQPLRQVPVAAARLAQALAAMTPDERALLERLQDITRANAEETVRSLLGAPVVEDDVGKMWSLTTPDGTSTLGLVMRWGSIAFIWQFRGFTYARRL